MIRPLEHLQHCQIYYMPLKLSPLLVSLMLPDPASPSTSDHLSASLTESLASSHSLNVLKILYWVLPPFLTFSPKESISRSWLLLLSPFFSYTNLSLRPQTDISSWVSCSISDVAVCSKPSQFSFLANSIRRLSPSHGPRLKMWLKCRHHLWFYFPPNKSISFEFIQFYFPNISKWPPPTFRCHWYSPYQGLCLPRELPRLLTGLASAAALAPICNQSDVDLSLLSQPDVSHSLRSEILHYVPVSHPPQPLAWHPAPRQQAPGSSVIFSTTPSNSPLPTAQLNLFSEKVSCVFASKLMLLLSLPLEYPCSFSICSNVAHLSSSPL